MPIYKREYDKKLVDQKLENLVCKSKKKKKNTGEEEYLPKIFIKKSCEVNLLYGVNLQFLHM